MAHLLVVLMYGWLAVQIVISSPNMHRSRMLERRRQDAPASIATMKRRIEAGRGPWAKRARIAWAWVEDNTVCPGFNRLEGIRMTKEWAAVS